MEKDSQEMTVQELAELAAKYQLRFEVTNEVGDRRKSIEIEPWVPYQPYQQSDYGSCIMKESKKDEDPDQAEV